MQWLMTILYHDPTVDILQKAEIMSKSIFAVTFSIEGIIIIYPHNVT